MRLIILSVLGVGAGLAVIAGLEWLRRRREYWMGPNYRAQLDAWQQAEPHIPPAGLPEIAPVIVTRKKLKKQAELLRWQSRKAARKEA